MQLKQQQSGGGGGGSGVCVRACVRARVCAWCARVVCMYAKKRRAEMYQVVGPAEQDRDGFPGVLHPRDFHDRAPTETHGLARLGESEFIFTERVYIRHRFAPKRLHKQQANA